MQSQRSLSPRILIVAGLFIALIIAAMVIVPAAPTTQVSHDIAPESLQK